MTALNLKNVCKSFGSVEVLKDIDLTVEDGEFVVFVGPSGCGKSTLLRVIAGLEDATSGTVTIGGNVVNAVPPAKRGIAMVFQSYALYPHLSVRDNMSLGLQQEKQPKYTNTQCYGKHIDRMHINRVIGAKKPFAHCADTMCQRVQHHPVPKL